MAMDPTPSHPTSSGSAPLRIPELAATTSSFTPGHSASEPCVIDSPVSPASPNAFARFEFETGRGNDGSKILMVEWDPAPSGEDGWVVAWDAKTTTFPVIEKVEDDDDDDGGIIDKEGQRRQRVYFLLPSDATVPPAVTISHAGSGRTLTAKAMPAIFAPGLGIGSRDAGRRGVLHTIWARLRAGQLQDEIRAELRDNSESVGLEMAVQERLWIIDHFGLDDLRVPDTNPNVADAGSIAQSPPQSPRSPVGGRLGEKLKGLKLATSPSDLANHSGAHYSHQRDPYIPRRDPPPPGKKDGLAMRTGADAGNVASLDAVLGGNKQTAAPPLPYAVQAAKETEDELFALPMSPRSPDMGAISPFSLLR
ncbi:uncharacterized protein F4812DRAFT_397947 [Daldinia caldariorum]|uniref:uncharacterized protein n=1 Tax=Daldinia caldariorum TaxID=326644 RepID=UPI0020081BA1|nr:uncharacterized protein F4812DRAFT_397947 [Daldinia caldariorum]KAI1467457.1 hypothetical protein F4812DRAFT_397947 [Daldinia caldariorum]